MDEKKRIFHNDEPSDIDLLDREKYASAFAEFAASVPLQ